MYEYNIIIIFVLSACLIALGYKYIIDLTMYEIVYTYEIVCIYEIVYI